MTTLSTSLSSMLACVIQIRLLYAYGNANENRPFFHCADQLLPSLVNIVVFLFSPKYSSEHEPSLRARHSRREYSRGGSTRRETAYNRATVCSEQMHCCEGAFSRRAHLSTFVTPRDNKESTQVSTRLVFGKDVALQIRQHAARSLGPNFNRRVCDAIAPHADANPRAYPQRRHFRGT